MMEGQIPSRLLERCSLRSEFRPAGSACWSAFIPSEIFTAHRRLRLPRPDVSSKKGSHAFIVWNVFMSDTKPSARRPDLRELIALGSPWPATFRLAVLAQVVSMVFGLLFPWLIGHLVDAAVPSVKVVGPDSWQPEINTVALVLLVTLTVQAVLTFFYSAAFQSVGQRTVVGLRKRLYGRLIELPMKFFGEHRVGELTSRLGSDMTILEEFYCGSMPQAIRQGMLLFGGMIAIFLTSPRLSGLMLLSFPVFIALAVLFGRSVRKISRQAQDRLAEAGTVVEETLQGNFQREGFWQ